MLDTLGIAFKDTEHHPMGDTHEQPSSDASVRHEATTPPGTLEPHSREDARGDEGSAGGADPRHSHLFHLAGMAVSRYEGGELRGANADNWSILKDQQGSVYIARLSPGGVREPHWHPSGWELNYVIAGKVRWSFVGPGGTSDTFEGRSGDLIFAPQGHFHYFENASETEDLHVLIVFNTSAGEPDDDIGLAESLSAIPADVLASTFGAPADTFRNLPHRSDRVVITRKRDR